MKTSIRSLILVSVLLGPMAAYAADGDSLGTKVTDSVITTKVKAEFAKDKTVSASDIKVETDSNGLVELSGAARSKAEAKRAVAIAKNVEGVKSVKDEIVVVE